MLDCREPSRWPAPPAEMTFSVLTAIEGCARRWALQNAEYPALWDRRGYPSKIVMGALVGAIAHSVVKTLTREFVAAGCSGVHDGTAIGAMRKLGGYTSLITGAIVSEVESWRGNPRALPVVANVERTLRAKAPEIRGYVQTLLSQVRFVKALVARSEGGQRRRALTQGVFSELVLRANRIQWKGKVDLLSLDQSGCEIVEFKTGQASAKHGEQVRMYAVLWWMEDELNPASKVPTKLTVVYPTGKEDVACPSPEDLRQLADEMTQRSELAKKSVRMVPPPAKPAVEVCRFCGVRQLCREYWAPESSPMAAMEGDGNQLADVQVIIEGRHGPTSWDATVEAGTRLQPKSRILIRSGSPGLELEREYRIRVVDAWLSQDPEAPESTRVVTLGAHSEVYRVD